MDDVAGYRVLRTAGRGTRSRLLLGFDAGVTVVLKVCLADDDRVAVEVEALERAAGEHVVALLDLASDEHGSVLVLERLPQGSLGELLERRGTLAAGEAVTILAPLATTLERLHAAGVAHGGLSLASICFDAHGAPALTGFGAAELFPAGAPEVVRETVAGVLADRAALRGLAALVLDRVTGDGAPAARRLATGMPDGSPAQLADALYAVASPVAVDLDAAADDAGEPWTLPPVEAFDVVDDVLGEPAPAMPPWLAALVPDAWRERITSYAELARSAWAGWPVARRRFVLGGAAAVLTVVVALGLVPSAPRVDAARPPDEVVAVPSGGPVDPADALPDDPVDAAVVLLATRDGCLRDLSVLCLDAVVQPGSAAQSDDVALVRAVQAGGEFPDAAVLPGTPVLVERLGDSALLDLPAGSSPGSLLLFRTAEGWRIRDYVDAPAFETGSGADAG